MGLCANEFVETNLVNIYAMAGGDTGVIKARKVFDTMTQQNVVTWNSMLAMYLRLGCADEAQGTFDVMPERNGMSWVNMIAGCMHSGKSSVGEGERVPDEVTFLGVLCACSHTGMVNEGRHYFKYMTQEYDIEPRIKHYRCFVDLLERVGLQDEAYELIAAIGYFTLLSNAYASADRWVDVANVRQKMVEMGVKKPPGHSQIQVNDEKRMKVVELGIAHGLVNMLKAVKDDRTCKETLKALVTLSHTDMAVGSLHLAGASLVISSTPDSTKDAEVMGDKSSLLKKF
ncbi:hypothetical protein GIB67_018967 [Kingdonia uniflora]|uniref:Pentatricopeptide repeat-containing protein n=1 Tax=Kingdonia uniflora TaxID=39325 RepID=A0A7J7MGJ7_9MAGN|nr:hypothetical protein GIB67_018967 [Kingdonia uniflora]